MTSRSSAMAAVPKTAMVASTAFASGQILPNSVSSGTDFTANPALVSAMRRLSVMSGAYCVRGFSPGLEAEVLSSGTTGTRATISSAPAVAVTADRPRSTTAKSAGAGRSGSWKR